MPHEKKFLKKFHFLFETIYNCLEIVAITCYSSLQHYLEIKVFRYLSHGKPVNTKLFPLEYIALLDKLLVTCKRSVHYYVDLKIIKYMSDEKPVKGRRFFLQFNAPSNTFVVTRSRT